MSETDSLIDRLVRGEQAAQKLFYEKHYSRFMYIALRYVNTRNEAMSVVNDSFMKIFRSIETLQDREKLNSWTASLVRNTTLDYLRKRVKYERRHSLVEEEHKITINDALQALSIEEIMKHIHSLSTKERIVFSLYAIDGFMHKEISERLNISEGTSKWYLNKARRNLQMLLKPYVS